MRVQLIQMTDKPIEVMWTAARTCYASGSPIDMWNYEKYSQTQEEIDNGVCVTDDWIEECTEKHWNLVKKVLDSGHQSIAEHVNFTFAIEGISRACYDDKTEVLTNNGWKLFRNTSENDEFATLNKFGQVEFQKASDFISYNYNGDMHYYNSQNINLCVTPNHNLYIKKYDVRTASEYNLVPSEKVDIKRFYMTKSFNYNPTVSRNINIKGYQYTRNYKNEHKGICSTGDLSLPKEYFFPFMAWYLSDGSTYYNKEENSYCISISQTKCSENILSKTRERIQGLVRMLGFNAYTDNSSVKFKNLTMGNFLKSLGHCDEKYIPWNIFEEFNQPLAKLFIDEYFKGDGHIDKNGCGKLYTSSSKLAEQLYQLCFIAGYTCKMHKIEPRGEHYINNILVKSLKPSYVINVTLTEKGRNRNIVIKKDKHFQVKEYNGKVYCVTVPNHTLFVRRNNIAVWCGNCSHQLVRHRHCTFSQQSQRYVEIKEDLRQLCEYEVHGNIEEIKKIVDKYFTYEHQDEMWACFESLKSYLRLVEKGRKPEDARAVLPNATKTNIVMSCNLRELIHMCHLRLCTRAQYEIRDMFKSIVALVETEDERIASLLVPQCEAQGFCTEHKCCGRKPKLKHILNTYNLHIDFLNSVEYLTERDWKCMGADIENPRVNENLRKFMNTKNEFDENR